MPKTTNDILFEGYDLEDKYSMNQAELTVNKVTEWEKFVHKKWFSEEEMKALITNIFDTLEENSPRLMDSFRYGQWRDEIKKKYGVE